MSSADLYARSFARGWVTIYQDGVWFVAFFLGCDQLPGLCQSPPQQLLPHSMVPLDNFLEG